METTVKSEWYAKLEELTDGIPEGGSQKYPILEGQLCIRKVEDSEGHLVFLVELTERGKERPHEQFLLDVTGVFEAVFEHPSIIYYPPADIDFPAYQIDEDRQKLAQRRAELIVEFIQTRLSQR